MEPMQRVLALLLGTTVLLTAVVAILSHPATADEGGASIEQQDATEIEPADADADADTEVDGEDASPDARADRRRVD